MGAGLNSSPRRKAGWRLTARTAAASRRGDPRERFCRILALAVIVGALVAAHPHHKHHPHHPSRYTGYVVEGRTSTFGWPLEGGQSGGETADGGNTRRPCIALRDRRSLGRWFDLTVNGRHARVLHCDSGPYAAGRQIDITGLGVEALGYSPGSYPTEAWGVARELR